MANTITGMIKILYQNYLTNYTNTITASSGSTGTANLTDLDRITRWASIGSSDIITEYIEVEFNSTKTITRMLLLDMNFKDFHVFYWDGSGWADFANVWTTIATDRGAVYGTAIYGTDVYSANLDVIADSDNADDSRYFEFDSVSTTKVRIECTSTIVANAEKYMYELYIGTEVGTFIEDLTSAPNSVNPIRSDVNAIYSKKSNGGTIRYERSDKYAAKFVVKELLESADRTIMNTMYDYGQFAFLPCGAVPYTERGMRMKDFYHVVIEGNEQAEFSIGRVSAMGMNYTFALREQ